MKRTVSLVCLLLLIAVSAFAADPTPAPAAAAAASQAPSFMAWIMANSTAIFAVALAVSEFLSLVPGFQGNGILDSVIKTLTVLSKKPDSQ